MPKQNIQILESLKKLKPLDFVYPGIFLLFFVVVIVVFSIAMQFISKNINKAFAPEDNTPSKSLNIEQYKLVSKRLNIELSQSNNTVVPAETLITTEAVTSTTSPTIDKKSLTIIVRNSTPTSGVATTLAKTLEGSGFTKPQTGNEPKAYPVTTVIIKGSKSVYSQLILDAVRKIYPEAIVATTTEAAAFDATVIIGTK